MDDTLDHGGAEEHHEGTSASSAGTVSVDWEGLDLASIYSTSIEPEGTNVRILMLPMVEGVSVSPYREEAGGFNWVQVNMMDPSRLPAKLLAVAPSSDHVGCCITYGGADYILYLNPSNDCVILRNNSWDRVVVELSGESGVIVEMRSSITLEPSTWAINSISGICLVQFKILSLKTWRITSSSAREAASEGESPDNPLLTLERGEIITIGAGNSSYQLTYEEPIPDRQFSSVWRGQHSKMPGKIVAAKVIKPDSSQRDATIDAAESFLHENSIHSFLGAHPAIIPYLGCDARFHTIYTEHVDAKSLLYHVKDDQNKFNGNAVSARRILGDMASALSFLHKRGVVHGDVKLGNIIFDPVRGAVLGDFNHSFKEEDPLNSRGSPWYLPPEYLRDSNSRGPASDMWALGIVLLWALHYIPMPDQQGGWDIADLHPCGPVRETNKTVHGSMTNWLNRVLEAKFRLRDKGGEIETAVGTLLQQNRARRSDAETLEQLLAQSNL
ncbi:hypothetical protein GQX73_g10513 [Xylaria multiplex]|uniref:Protein kinase domain-containing protein n=1 Tax=Xylaria multiplex TaxID=323545 RepID=A0A7C8ISS0_9PEZI|nr:hypothetical protein GQX73_g10513 [Xylaria multiplex]